jgi:tetratricopeptide (TPR) repeat protein
MKLNFPALGLAVAVSLAESIAKAPAIAIRKMNGSAVDVAHVSGTLTHVDQGRRSFAIQFQGKGPTQMGYIHPSYEQTYIVTESTVYKNGSWAALKPGVQVVVSGHSTVADTVAFGAGTKVAQNATALNQRGLAKQGKGDLDGAMADYNQAIQLDPKYSAAYDNRGNLRRQKGDLSGALADTNQAISLNPKNAIACFNRAKVKEAKGDLDGAIADFNKAISLNPRYGAAYRERGNARQKKGDVNGASADLNQAAKLGAKS